MRSLSLLLLGAALLVAASTLPAASDAASWAPVNPRGVVIQQVARFAVIVYDLAHHVELSYAGVVGGETEEAVGGGIFYRLVLAVDKPNGAGRAQYECLVWGVPGSSLSTWKLRRFRKV